MKQKREKILKSSMTIMLIAYFFIAGLLGNESKIMALSAIVINVLFALSYNILFGYAGMMSLGHSLYYGMGAYFVLIFILKCGFSIGISVIFALIASVIFAFLMGFVCLKNGISSFSFLSMGISVTFCTMFTKWAWIGSDVGLQTNIRPAWMSNYKMMYITVLAVVVLCAIIIFYLAKSPFIKGAKSLRENEERLIFLGVDTQKQRLIIFVVSAFFASIAGILSAFRNNGAYVASLENTLATQAIIMCMLGGCENYFGPIIGAIVVTLFYNKLSGITIYYQGILGLVILLIVFFMRDGIISKKTLSTLKMLHAKIGRVKKGENQ